MTLKLSSIIASGLLQFCTYQTFALACDDLEFDFSEYQELENRTASSFFYDSIGYLLKSFLPRQIFYTVDGYRFTLPCNFINSQQLSRLQFLELDPNFLALRKLVTLYYNDNRNNRYNSDFIPENLADFESQFKYLSWKKKIKNPSAVKDAKRIIYSNSDISVAQTILSQDGLESVRETEVILENNEDGDVTFVVFDSGGKLSSRSTFKNNVQANAPYACMACHYDTVLRKFVRDTRI